MAFVKKIKQSFLLCNTRSKVGSTAKDEKVKHTFIIKNKGESGILYLGKSGRIVCPQCLIGKKVQLVVRVLK